jgi:hypothetical protein
VRLSEQEGALFLPALVDKCGHPMEAVRDKFRKVLRMIPGRGCHSLTFHLNVSAFCGIGVAFRDF